jgi:hypothetical protein
MNWCFIKQISQQNKAGTNEKMLTVFVSFEAIMFNLIKQTIEKIKAHPFTF